MYFVGRIVAQSPTSCESHILLRIFLCFVINYHFFVTKNCKFSWQKGVLVFNSQQINNLFSLGSRFLISLRPDDQRRVNLLPKQTWFEIPVSVCLHEGLRRSGSCWHPTPTLVGCPRCAWWLQSHDQPLDI